ncbi:MAG TPA: MoxR family ATPase, partial [Planctomycetaceae bacterium]|nr:MoxR family ATPase [Planctomycetaceae bacterium]
DEINRASPRTQSALLEAMNEGQATIEGQRYPLEPPFLVLATQNPIEFQGTYPLPEAQLDRFLIELDLGYPDADTEVRILYDQQQTHPLERIGPVMTRQDVLAVQQHVRRVHVDESVARYMVEIVRRTRSDGRLKLGVSPRGSLMLFRAAQAAAFLDGRDFVLPDDVQRLLPYVLPHRMVLTSKTRYGNTTARQVIDELIEQVRVPT